MEEYYGFIKCFISPQTLIITNKQAFNTNLDGVYYQNKRHIQVLYDGFKLSIGCIKAMKPEGLSDFIQQIDSLKLS